MVIKKMMYCPLCGEEHLVDVKKRSIVGLIKEEKVVYEEVYFVCCEEEEEFITTKQMDANLLAARNAYRIAHKFFEFSGKDMAINGN